jgi:hypothetical protein
MKTWQKCVCGVTLGLFIAACLFLALQLLVSRTREFHAQARLGQPIVQAIGQFKGDTGDYPSSLANLYPKYLRRRGHISIIEK